MGSDSDLHVMQAAVDVLTDFSVPFEVRIVSAHRTPQFMVEFAESAKSRGLQLIIAGAGGAAHLPGMVASLTELPVIGVPVQVGKLAGLDALLSVAQMPRGVPVATMAVDNATNAALFAVRILALQNPKLSKKLIEFMERNRTRIRQIDKKVQTQMKKGKS